MEERHTYPLPLSRVVRMARKDVDLSQKELAALVGKHYRTVQMWENGELDPSPHLPEIERACRKPAGWILDRADPLQRVLRMADDLDELKQLVRDLIGIVRYSGGPPI